jgi:nucleoside triphosphate pyrophosphatase
LLILASKSPRRREILANAGLAFEVRAADVEEVRLEQESAIDYVQRLAREKAQALLRNPGDIVLAADTVVVVGGLVLEKPASDGDAASMLEALAGRGHEVMTGICLAWDGEPIVDVETTRVYFAPMSDAEIEGYVASGEPMDKAGAYAIQGLASKFIERIEGDYFNVVGLPVARVYRHLRSIWQEQESSLS